MSRPIRSPSHGKSIGRFISRHQESGFDTSSLDDQRPTTRGECRTQQRPCPWVGCRHHLYLDVKPETGKIVFNFPGLEVWELRETCALDVADRNGFAFWAVGGLVNISRQRAMQIEEEAIAKLKSALAPEPEDRTVEKGVDGRWETPELTGRDPKGTVQARNSPRLGTQARTQQGRRTQPAAAKDKGRVSSSASLPLGVLSLSPLP